MSECDTTWWTLGKVVDWVRGVHPTATVGQIRAALEKRCASDRIRTRGHRRLYGSDRPLPIDHGDPNFVWFADRCGEPQSWFDAISTDEWTDLTFFARPTPETGEQYRAAVVRALDQLDSPVEVRSRSKWRLAWKDVEFWRDDVIREWPDAGDVARQNEAEREPRSDAAGETTGGRPAARFSTRAPVPLSDQDLYRWYDHRVVELSARGEVASGEADWEAAKQQFAGRVTRARIRAVRDQLAPAGWRKQGRRPPRTAM